MNDLEIYSTLEIYLDLKIILLDFQKLTKGKQNILIKNLDKKIKELKEEQKCYF